MASKGVATIEATEATDSVKSFSPSIPCNSLDFPNSYYHAIDMLKFSQYTSVKNTPWLHPWQIKNGVTFQHLFYEAAAEDIKGFAQTFYRAYTAEQPWCWEHVHNHHSRQIIMT